MSSWWRSSRSSIRVSGRGAACHQRVYARLRRAMAAPQSRDANGPRFSSFRGTFAASAAPAILPDLLADQARHARLPFRRRLLRHRDDAALWRAARDLEQEFGPYRLPELVLVLDRHHEGARAADHAILVVPVEILDIHRRKGGLLDHDRKAVDGNALGERGLPRGKDRRAVVVGPVAGNIDDTPQPAIRVGLEQRHGKIDRARNRGARGATDRRLHDFVGDGVRGFGAIDYPPGNDHFL